MSEAILKLFHSDEHIQSDKIDQIQKIKIIYRLAN